MGAERRDGGVKLPEPLRGLQERQPVLLIFLRHYG
jgi:hypothetical protein